MYKDYFFKEFFRVFITSQNYINAELDKTDADELKKTNETERCQQI